MLHSLTAKYPIRRHINCCLHTPMTPTLLHQSISNQRIPSYHIISSRSIHTHWLHSIKKMLMPAASRGIQKSIPNPNPHAVNKDRITHIILTTSEKTFLRAREPKCFTYRWPTIQSKRAFNNRPTNCLKTKVTTTRYDGPTYTHHPIP